MHWNRRQFIARTAGLSVIASAGVVFYTCKIGPQHLRIAQYDMPLPHLPDHWRGKKLVHISDLHIGKDVDDNYLMRCFGCIADFNPDIIVFTGDFMTCVNDEEIEHVRTVLAHLQPAKLGTIGIFGNHDYAQGWKNHQVADALAEQLSHTEMTILRNQSLNLDGLHFFGMDDLWAKRFNPETTFKGIKTGQAHIALTHNPDTVDCDGWNKFHGWILAGHTHGGQCRPPFLPPPLLPVNNRRYTQGIFDLGADKGMLHISPGLGHLNRVRFLARPEITVFTLV